MLEDISKYRSVIENFDVDEEKKKMMYENCDQISDLLDRLNIFRMEVKKVGEYNQKIKDQVDKLVKTGENNTVNISYLTTQLMDPSPEAENGININRERIEELVMQNIRLKNGENPKGKEEIEKKNFRRVTFSENVEVREFEKDDTKRSIPYSPTVIVLIFINLIFWMIVFYLIFFGPKLRLP